MCSYAALAWSICYEGVQQEVINIEEYTKDIKDILYYNTSINSNCVDIIISYLDPDKDYIESKKGDT